MLNLMWHVFRLISPSEYELMKRKQGIVLGNILQAWLPILLSSQPVSAFQLGRGKVSGLGMFDCLHCCYQVGYI